MIMKDNSLISLLKTFSREEMNKFERFLLSPYFTEGKNIRSNLVNKYFRALKNFYPDFKGTNFSKKYFFRLLYPKSKYSDSALRKIDSDLLKLAEKFLIQIQSESDLIESKKSLMHQLVIRNNEKLFRKSFDSMMKYLEGLKRDEDYYYETYFIWLRYWEFYYGKKTMYKLGEATSNFNNFFIYVLLGSLRIYLYSLSLYRIINKKNDLLMFEEILDFVEKNAGKLSHVPQILFYYNLIRLVTLKDEKYFNKLKELKSKTFDSLTELDKQNFYIMTTNFCNDMIAGGNFQFRKERFRLDKEFMNLLYKLNPNKLHVFYMLAASKNANRLNEFKWVSRILKSYESNTMDDNKDFMINFIKADICFLKKEYDSALKYLSKIKTSYSNQKQNIRNLTIQIFYEMSLPDSAVSVIETSMHFLNRDKYISERSKIQILNFIRLTKQLIGSNSDNSKLVFLKKKITETSDVANKEWLLEKVSEQI